MIITIILCVFLFYVLPGLSVLYITARAVKGLSDGEIENRISLILIPLFNIFLLIDVGLQALTNRLIEMKDLE